MPKIKEYFKKEWWKIYLCDLGWISLITVFLIYSRYKISAYLSLINSYAGDFNIIQQEISNNTAAGAYKLQMLLSEVSPLVDKLNTFVFFIVPAVVFLIWILFNSIEYSILRKEKIRYLIPAFMIITLPFYLILIYLANQLLTIIKDSMFGDWKLYLILIIMMIICYLLHLSYSFLTTKDIKGSSVKWISSIIHSAKSSLPIFILYSLSLAFMFGSVLNIAIKYVTGSVGSTFWSFVSALLAILAMGLTKYLLHSSLAK